MIYKARKYGYARVSTTDQDLTLQYEALNAAGCITVFAEKQTGTSVGKRTQLRTLLDVVQEGDEVIITRIDRLARSMKDLQDIVHELKGKGVALKATEQPIDTGSAAGKCFLDMLGVFAEFETNLRKERQLEGIAKAKAEGVYAKNKGRNATIDAAKVKELHASGMGATEIAKTLGFKSRSSVYRLIAE
jgi:DNA invertase Pin-like site-specific DNA recombinase